MTIWTIYIVNKNKWLEENRMTIQKNDSSKVISVQTKWNDITTESIYLFEKDEITEQVNQLNQFKSNLIITI